MRKMAIIILLILFSLPAYSPIRQVAYIEQSPEINYYQRLIDAITFVESHNGRYVYNAAADAVGWFQVRDIRVHHYTRLTGSDYVLEDFYDYDLSREMFLYFASGKSYERSAKSWNGSGPLTEIYWNKVKAAL